MSATDTVTKMTREDGDGKSRAKVLVALIIPVEEEEIM